MGSSYGRLRLIVYCSPCRSEAEIIQKIVEMILHKLNNMFSIDTKGLIGIDSQVDKLIRYLAIGLDDVRFIGIQVIGGMDKTTLARVVYSIQSNKFEACSFIDNIREVSKKMWFTSITTITFV